MTDYGHDPAFDALLTPSAANPDQTVALTRLAEAPGQDLATFQDYSPADPGLCPDPGPSGRCHQQRGPYPAQPPAPPSTPQPPRRPPSTPAHPGKIPARYDETSPPAATRTTRQTRA
jgi:hypothetical protein